MDQEFDNAFSISEKLGRGHELSDAEFCTWMLKQYYVFSFKRRFQIFWMLLRNPWRNESKQFIAQMKESKEHYRNKEAS